MKTIDQIQKIKAVVEYILQHFNNGVDYIHLFKVMYFAQEEHLAIYGTPLMDESFVARKHGPVPSFTYKVLRVAEGKISDKTGDLTYFVSEITLHNDEGHQVVTLKGKTCDMDELSNSNIRVLDKWINKCKDLKSFDLSELSHDKAWQEAVRQMERTGEDVKISLYDMAEAGGATKDMLNVIRERQKNKRTLSWI